MKKRNLLSMVSFFVMTAMWANLKEKYQMYVSADANGKTGANATLTLNLKNQNFPAKWQCTVALPEGVTYVEGTIAEAGARYPEGFNPTFNATVNSDGTVTFFCEGEEGMTLTNTDGVVATFDVAVAADVALGDVKVIVNSSKLTEPNGTIWEWVTPNEFTWTIEQGEEPVKPGDVNADGTVDISDVVEVLYQMANGGTADVNGDGTTDISDVVEVLSIMAAQ
jgi:hypothetical protein